MSITLTHGGLPEKINRKDLENLVGEVGDAVFGFSDKTIALLRHYVARCFEGDYLPGRICGMWEQPHATATALRISTRALSYKERELEEAGLILRTGTAHASRTGKRVGDRIVYLAGINLGPLIDRFGELQDMLAIQRQQNDALPLLRLQISEARARIRMSGDPELIALANAKSCGGRTRRITNIEQLRAISTALDEIVGQLALPSGAKFTSDRSEAGFVPYLPSKSSEESNTASSLPKSWEANLESITPAVAIRLASERFRDSLNLIGGPTWPNVIEASRRTGLQIGISKWVWGQACAKLGKVQTALRVLAIDRNHCLPQEHPFHCKRPSGALFMMAQKAGSQDGFSGLMCAIARYPDNERGDGTAIAQELPLPPLKGVRSLGNLAATLAANAHNRVEVVP